MFYEQFIQVRPLENQLAVFWLGQAGFVIKRSNGTVLAIDPYLSDCCERYFGFKRLIPHLLSAQQLRPDYLITTHAHYDHFDPDSVPTLLAHGGELVAAMDCRLECERLGIPTDKRAHFLRVGDAVSAPGIHITAVPCDHGDMTPDAIGLLLEIDGKRIYVAGDTAFHKDYFSAPLLHEADLAILPINGAFGNLDALQAAEAAALLQPRLTVPCHFWNFAEHGGDPALFATEMQKHHLPYCLMPVGSYVLLK